MAYVFLSLVVCLVLYFVTAAAQCLRKPRILTNEEGTIQLLNRNEAGLFDIGKDCKWIFEAPSGKRIVLTFDQEFDIPRENNLACDVTYLRVFDGNNTDARNFRGRYCGQIAPQRIISSSNMLLVEFRSADKATPGRGFTARYEHIDASSLEFRVFRDKKTWNEANVACRNKSGFLVSLSDRNRVEIQQQMRDYESVWSGAFSVWMWTRRCYKYEILSCDRIYYSALNSASWCQRRCGTDQVWLKGRICLCNISVMNAELTEYKNCNQTCPTEPSDVCGGPGSVIHYETWKGYPDLLEDIDGKGNCVYITPRSAGGKWHIDSCYKSYLPLCKKKNKEDPNVDNYFIPSGFDQNFASYGFHFQALENCIENKSMIADISGFQKLNSVITYLGNAPGLPSYTPQLWIGLKRKREIITQYNSIVPSENSNFSCYFIHQSPTGTIEELVGSCKMKMAYVCKLSVELRQQSTYQTPTSTSYSMRTEPSSTVKKEVTSQDMTNVIGVTEEQKSQTSTTAVELRQQSTYQTPTSTSYSMRTEPSSTVKKEVTSQDMTNVIGVTEEQKSQTSTTVPLLAAATVGLAVTVAILIIIICIRKRNEISNDRTETETRNNNQGLEQREQPVHAEYEELEALNTGSASVNARNIYQDLGEREQQTDNQYQQLQSVGPNNIYQDLGEREPQADNQYQQLQSGGPHNIYQGLGERQPQTDNQYQQLQSVGPNNIYQDLGEREPQTDNQYQQL